MNNGETSSASVPVRALTVWRNVNAECERFNQNLEIAANTLNDLQKILEQIEEKNKSLVEGFMQAQEAARKLSEQSSSADGDAEKAKKSFMDKLGYVLDVLNINTFEVAKYFGEKAVARLFSRKQAASGASAGEAGGGAATAGGAVTSNGPEKKGDFLSKTVSALKGLDVASVFDKAKSLGEKAIKGAAKGDKTDVDENNWKTLQDNINGAYALIGQKALVALRPALDALNNAFKSDQMTAAINLMANLFLVAATAISMVVEGLIYMGGVIQQNWSVIGPILAAIAFVYLAAMIVQVYSLAAAWLVANWPILLIVAAVALLIYILMQSGVTVGEVVVAIAEGFGWLKGFIENIVIGLYNTFIIFADFFRNLFIDPSFAVKKLFYDLAMNFLNFIYQMALGVENFAGGFVKVIASAVNKVLTKFKAVTDFLSNIPGFENLANVKVNLLDPEDPHVFSGMIDNVRKMIPEPVSDKPVINSQKKAFVDPSIAAKQYGQVGKDTVDKFNTKVKELKDDTKIQKQQKMLQNPGQGNRNSLGNMNNMGNINNVARVGEVGSVKDNVDISSDDLAMLRDLAEIQAIQNFVELTPTVQVTTGNINNAGDIDSIINKINQKLSEEFVSTAQGVYT
ncbi:phage tail tape measure protein [Paenibacillus durus]|uniref:Tail length tape measure protein n=1 Tax=Paenibacillus durus ATCC 35681 TaxID=1333534 RepID=A0A0F7FDC7_PAEDU|nr:hypothetical protein [Paenibacillus durus]AKG36484.1 hypothetical protein VK70_19640 [Paenibacillus durus ATCC 35681]